VSGNDPNIEHTFEIDVVDEGFFCLQVDFEEISEEKASVREKMGEEKDKNKREQYNKTLISLDQFESKINLFKINLVPHNPNRAEDDVCIRKRRLTQPSPPRNPFCPLPSTPSMSA
jgi:hypothetical protein